MKIQTNQLTGPALDWAVAKCEGTHRIKLMPEEFVDQQREGKLIFSTNWAQGGPIIEREKITPEWTGEDWMGYIRHDEEFFGPTPLIAAMRCFVASKLGDEVDVPNELIEV